MPSQSIERSDDWRAKNNRQLEVAVLNSDVQGLQSDGCRRLIAKGSAPPAGRRCRWPLSLSVCGCREFSAYWAIFRFSESELARSGYDREPIICELILLRQPLIFTNTKVQSFDHLEMSLVPDHEGQAFLQGSRGDQGVKDLQPVRLEYVRSKL